MKTCRSCGETKPLDAFPSRGDGLRHDCKVCRAAKIRVARHAEPERSILATMIQRCHNPKHPRFPLYGGRGIVVCERWRESFDAFLADVGPRPSPTHSIDRIDVNGNYEPGNVRWATQRQQMSNTRRNRMITVAGRTQTLAAWKEETGITNLSYRLGRGMSPEDAVAAPPRPRRRMITLDGVTLDATQWSRRLGGEASLVATRLGEGWTEAEAVSIPKGGRRQRRAS